MSVKKVFGHLTGEGEQRALKKGKSGRIGGAGSLFEKNSGGKRGKSHDIKEKTPSSAGAKKKVGPKKKVGESASVLCLETGEDRGGIRRGGQDKGDVRERVQKKNETRNASDRAIWKRESDSE